jgi:hypothetical protein
MRTNVPEAGVLAEIERERPALIGVSVTMPFNLPKAVSLVRRVQAQASCEPRIMLGGAVDLCRYRTEAEPWAITRSSIWSSASAV